MKLERKLAHRHFWRWPRRAAAQVPPITLTPPASRRKRHLTATALSSAGLLLEPIESNGLTDSAVQAAVKKEYFANQFTIVPRDGDKVTAGDAQLTWHAVDTRLYNVNLYHFAHALGKPTSNVLFWVVTVVNCPDEISRRAPGHRLERGFGVVGERPGSHRHLWRPPNRDRRRCLQTAHAQKGDEHRARRHRQRRRRHRLLRPVSRRGRQTAEGLHGAVGRR